MWYDSGYKWLYRKKNGRMWVEDLSGDGGKEGVFGSEEMLAGAAMRN